MTGSWDDVAKQPPVDGSKPCQRCGAPVPPADLPQDRRQPVFCDTCLRAETSR